MPSTADAASDAGSDTGSDTASDTGSDTAGPVTVRCHVCGVEVASPPPLDWSGEQRDGRRSWLCARCARENVRSIEAKLDNRWW